ncbi:DnaB-like helicase N-terminal domain-containing protein [Sphaerisporangium album]|nr:DnaB-like helicase N-terminal domain-containing protein [Sphaerisporangium album]
MTPIHFIERALLGALLNDPRSVHGVADLAGLQAEDFSTPLHRDLFATMVKAAAEANMHTIDGVNRFRRACGATALRHNRNARWLANLAASAPSGRAVNYGFLVNEAHTMRLIAHHIGRVSAALAQADPAAMELVGDELHEARRVVAKLADRWRVDPATTATPRPPAVSDPQAAPVPRWFLLARYQAAAQARRQAAREDRLIASLIGDPFQIEDVRGWLEASDFTAPGRGELYTALLKLYDSGQPFDVVTVVWDAAMNGGLDMDIDAFIARYDRAERGEAMHLARDLVRQSIGRGLDSQARQLLRAGGRAEAAVLRANAVLGEAARRWGDSRALRTADVSYSAPAASSAFTAPAEPAALPPPIIVHPSTPPARTSL